MVVLIIIVLGFLYGADYFKFNETYGTSSSPLPLGIYVLSFRWWNVKFNWYIRMEQWHVDISIVFPISIKEKKFREYILIITSTDVKVCTVDIN